MIITDIPELLNKIREIEHSEDIDQDMENMRDEWDGDPIEDIARYYLGQWTMQWSGYLPGVERDSMTLDYECPFCPSTKKLLKIMPDRGLFYCWCCQQGGDEIQLVMMLEFCGPYIAVQKIEEIFEELKSESEKAEEERKKEKQLLSKAKK